VHRLPAYLGRFLMACAANFGVVMLKKTLAPEFFGWIIWLSTVGSATIGCDLDDLVGVLAETSRLTAVEVVLP